MTTTSADQLLPSHGQTGSWPLRIADRYWETPFTTLILDQITRNGVRVALPTYRYKLSRPGWQNEISQADLQLPPRVLGCVLEGLFLDVSALLEELQIYLGIGEYSKSAMI